MDEQLQNLTDQSQEFMQMMEPYPWAQALALVFAGLIVAKLAEMFVSVFVARILARTDNSLDDKIAKLLRKPLFTTFAIIGLILAADSIGPELGERTQVITVAVLKTIIIFSWLRFLLGSCGTVLESMGRNPARFKFAQNDTVPLMKNLATVFLLLAGAYSILIAWDINVTGLVASAGIVGLALSFAAQDTLSHLFAGVAILADRPYRIGDYIVLDTGERGQVTHIGLRSTRLMTRDDVEVIIPNGVMGSAKIVNESGGGDTRFRIRAVVGVAYGSDVEHVLEILEAVAKDNKDLCEEPEPRARFRAFGASSLDFDLLAWIPEPSLRGLRVHELNIEIYRRFNAEGIKIPFPQQDVWIKELPRQDGDAPASA